jgi:cell wall-associated NlpC family hydrolase
MEGRVLTLRQQIVRCRLGAPIAGCLLATLLPVSVVRAEEGIPPGSGAVITAGASLAVRAAPGWDAAVSYEIADGSAVTVWDGAQAAPDGSLWYPVDGGFVPVDAVSSVASLKGDVALYQDSSQDATTGDGVEPATADPAGADSAALDSGMAAAAPEDGVNPAASDVVPETESKEALADIAGVADPATGAGTALATGDLSAGGAVDPATGTEGVTTAGEAVPVDAPSGTPAPVTTLGSDGTEPWGEPIATAYIAGSAGNGAPCLRAPDWGADTLTVLGEGEAVPVRAETMGEWQPVDCANAGGYVHTSVIAWSQTAAPDESDDGERSEREGGRDGKASGSNEIVDFALKYEGHPYVYAGEGPRAFDCSGFTMFVVQKTLGIDITHDMHVQYDMGSPVRRNALQPGDLVFFKNTFERGMSHTGIYIGNGQFIHAENESTGVRISDLDSDYYSSRWYGAVRYT